MASKLLAALGGLLVALAALGGLTLLLRDGEQETGAGSLAGLERFGFNDNAVAQERADPDEDAELSAAVGANVSRVTLDWRFVEPRPGEYDFSLYDAIDRALSERGIEPIWVILFAPEWALADDVDCDQDSEDCRFPPGPEHDAAFGALVAEIAQRYPGSAGIEAWNEPNLTHFWASGPDPARMAAMLGAARAALDDAGSDVPLVSGGLGGAVSQEGDIDSLDYTRALFEAGLEGVDAFGLHAYPRATDVGRAIERYERTRALLDGLGVTIPIWVTETGSSTGGGDFELTVTEEQQATVVVEVARGLAAAGAEAVLIHTLIDPPEPFSDYERGFGVLRGDLTPKPAYCALAVARGVPAPPTGAVPAPPTGAVPAPVGCSG